MPAISLARPRAPGARLPPLGAGSGSGASSRAAAASLGRRPPSPPPPPPRSSRDPPARAPRERQHGSRDATAAGSPETNLKSFSPFVQGQHHDTTAAPHCHFRRRRGKKKKKAIPTKRGVGGKQGWGWRPEVTLRRAPGTRGA